MPGFDDRKNFSSRDETSYRFLYRAPQKEEIFFWVIMALGILLIAINRGRRGEAERLVWLALLAFVALHHLFLRLSLLIDLEGIHQQWKIGSFSFSRHTAWQEVVQVQLGNEDMLPLKTGFRRLYFLGPLGNLKRQVDFTRYDVQVYAGVGHSLSLLQAIEKFHAVSEQTKSEREKLVLEVYKIGGKQVRIVAYTAVALALFLALLAIFSHVYYALGSVAIRRDYTMLCLAVGMVAFFAACAYTCLDKEARFPLALVPSALLGVVFGFLMVPLIDAAPVWLGEKSEEAFAVVREEDKAQHWQGTTSPDLAFTLFVPPEERAHNGVGSTKTLTFYRGPFGMASMEREEFRALFANRRKKAGLR